MDRDHDQVAKVTPVLTDSGARPGLPSPQPVLLAPSSPPHYLLSSGPTPQSPEGGMQPRSQLATLASSAPFSGPSVGAAIPLCSQT